MKKIYITSRKDNEILILLEVYNNKLYKPLLKQLRKNKQLNVVEADKCEEKTLKEK